MTTVSVTQRDARLDLFTLMRTWFSRDDAVYPFSTQYGDAGSQQQDTQEGQVEMITLPGLRDRGRAAPSSATTCIPPGDPGRRRHRACRPTASSQVARRAAPVDGTRVTADDRRRPS